jgi:hypothetical protein
MRAVERTGERLCQGQHGRKAGVTGAYVSMIERGEKQSPSIPVLKRLAKALGVPVKRDGGMNCHRARIAPCLRFPVLAMLIFGFASAVGGCGAVQTKAHEPLGSATLKPMQEDKDAGLVGVASGFNVRAYRIIAVDRIAVTDPEIKDGDGRKLADAMAIFFQSELVRRLRASGLFDRVISLAENPAPTQDDKVLKLEGMITQLSGGSRALRFWVGFGAGRSQAQAETRFTDASSKQVVLVTADRRVVVISEALSLDYGGDSEGLLKQSFDNMARDLVKFLTRLVRDVASPPSSPPLMSPPVTRSLEERLTELSDLKAAGKITDEEYATLRRKVIESHR